MEATKIGSHRRQKDKGHSAAAETETLNFRVTGEFKREFKGYAVSQGISMVGLLKEGFELTKRKRRSGPAGA
jgi:hypothetical protein